MKYNKKFKFQYYSIDHPLIYSRQKYLGLQGFTLCFILLYHQKDVDFNILSQITFNYN
jgi:hypothetical protein